MIISTFVAVVPRDKKGGITGHGNLSLSPVLLSPGSAVSFVISRGESQAFDFTCIRILNVILLLSQFDDSMKLHSVSESR